MTLWRLAARQACEIRRLRSDLVAEHHRRVATAKRLAAALRERDQYRRDAELLALMARDRRVALEFIATQHRIDRLEETR